MKNHSSWLEISKTSFDANISMYKQLVGQHRHIAPVIKSNAYGHGMLEIARLCQEHEGVTWVCVASVQEALALRAAHFRKKILLISFFTYNIDELLKADIDIVISSLQEAEDLNSLLAEQKISQKIRIHLKIDTGLSRFGIMPEDGVSAITRIHELSHLHFAGICTHFSQSSNADTTYTQLQYQRFNTLLDILEKKNLLPELIHASNTAATTLLPFNRCNLFRIGIGIYGIWPTPSNKEVTLLHHPWFKLTQILKWKARIMRIKTVPADTPIGYERSYITKRPTRIGMIPVGYFDGYDFRLSNCGSGVVNGFVVPIIGRVAMNVTLFDITDVPSCALGDEITLLGDHPDITAEAIAHTMNNPNIREFLATLNTNLPKKIIS